jgi:hypothetical protein
MIVMLELAENTLPAAHRKLRLFSDDDKTTFSNFRSGGIHD